MVSNFYNGRDLPMNYKWTPINADGTLARAELPNRVPVVELGCDLFAPEVSDGIIMSLWMTMAEETGYQFIVRTKHGDRMREWLARWHDVEGPEIDPKMARGPAAVREAHTSGRALLFAAMLDTMGDPPAGAAFPTYDWMNGPRWWTDPFNVALEENQ